MTHPSVVAARNAALQYLTDEFHVFRRPEQPDTDPDARSNGRGGVIYNIPDTDFQGRNKVSEFLGTIQTPSATTEAEFIKDELAYTADIFSIVAPYDSDIKLSDLLFHVAEQTYYEISNVDKNTNQITKKYTVRRYEN